MARDYRVPPTRMLGLPYKRWGETDLMLSLAYEQCESSRCGCGCGQWVDECQDPETSGWWEVEQTVCFAGVALAEWREQNKDAPAGTLVGVRLSKDYERLPATP